MKTTYIRKIFRLHVMLQFIATTKKTINIIYGLYRTLAIIVIKALGQGEQVVCVSVSGKVRVIKCTANAALFLCWCDSRITAVCWLVNYLQDISEIFFTFGDPLLYAITCRLA